MFQSETSWDHSATELLFMSKTGSQNGWTDGTINLTDLLASVFQGEEGLGDLLVSLSYLPTAERLTLVIMKARALKLPRASNAKIGKMDFSASLRCCSVTRSCELYQNSTTKCNERIQGSKWSKEIVVFVVLFTTKNNRTCSCKCGFYACTLLPSCQRRLFSVALVCLFVCLSVCLCFY